MNMARQKLTVALATLVLILAASASASALCTFTTVKKTMTLNGDCITTTSIIVPDGFTLDGAGHTITAHDPIGDHFKGGVIQNGGAAANVTEVTVTASGLIDACDSAAATRLRGILFDGASGSITNTYVLNINHVVEVCGDEGNGIEVRNFGTSLTTCRVRIDGNTVTGYQKNGITANGDVDATITDNVVDGLAPDSLIARNGIQLGFGATGMVKRNQVSNNEYTGPEHASASGILLVAGPLYSGSPYSVGAQIDQNTISENDVGVWVSELDLSMNAPATMTNVKVVNNTISKSGFTNDYQAGVSDAGNNDKIIANRISGAGYDPTVGPGIFAVDANPSFTNRAKVHANK
jgi:Right handed beta helix region